MAKKYNTKKTNRSSNKKQPASQQDVDSTVARIIAAQINNITGTQARSALLSQLIGDSTAIDFNYEGRYPTSISTLDYEKMFRRNGTARRVVTIWPEETWTSWPTIHEDQSAKNDTPFEAAWKELVKKRNIFHHILNADILSGIGSYGLLFLGLNDGKELNEPVDIASSGSRTTKRELLYLRAFSEHYVNIVQRETDVNNERYGLPTIYDIDMDNVKQNAPNQKTEPSKNKNTTKVHWTRVIHIADNALSSDIWGTPRMEPVFNYLMDLQKISAGSAEMLWRAGVGGTAWGLDENFVNPGVQLTTDQRTAMREQLQLFYKGLQRDLIAEGLKPMDIAPKLEDPTDFFKLQVQLICITLGVPYRIFLGSEEAKLASTQDRKSWLERVTARQEKYAGPMLIYKTIEHLQKVGVLPPTAEKPGIEWEDRDAPTSQEIAETATKTTQALKDYVVNGLDVFIEPKQYLMIVLKWTEEEADAGLIAAGQLLKEMREDDSDDDSSIDDNSSSVDDIDD